MLDSTFRRAMCQTAGCFQLCALRRWIVFVSVNSYFEYKLGMDESDFMSHELLCNLSTVNNYY